LLEYGEAVLLDRPLSRKGIDEEVRMNGRQERIFTVFG
jgi:hypothetical protein